MDMRNIFTNVDNGELKNIYIDYNASKLVGESVQSFREYALIIREKYFGSIDYPLGQCMEIVQRMYFEEIAKRFYEIA